jgi:hypothetical protein
MSAPELLPCPFCGNFPTMGRVNVSFCKTDGCIIEHRAIDLNLPEHIAAWNTRAVYPNTRIVTVDQLERWDACSIDDEVSSEIREIIDEVK